jgi:hypothetical protein
VFNALNRLVESYAGERARAKQERSVNEGQLADNEARIGTPFTHDYQRNLIELRDKFKLALSDKLQEGERSPSGCRTGGRDSGAPGGSGGGSGAGASGAETTDHCHTPAGRGGGNAQGQPAAPTVEEELPRRRSASRSG